MDDARRGAVPLAAAVLIAGCGVFDISDDTNAVQVLRIDTVVVEMKSRANDDWPARVSLVRVDDIELMNDLLHMDSRSWFGDGGKAFRNANPEAFYDDWEIVPGSRIGPFDAWVDEDVVGVMFCGTRGSSPPVRVTTDGDIRIEVDRRGCTVTEARREITRDME